MKKITMYELLNRVKEGKAPRRFIRADRLFVYNEEKKEYDYGEGWIQDGRWIIRGVNFSDIDVEIELPDEHDEAIIEKLNEVIDYINKKE